VNLSVALAAHDLRTTLLDADMGTANADLLCGVSPRRRLDAWLEGIASGADSSIDGLAIEAPGGFRLVPGIVGLSRGRTLDEAQRRAVSRGVDELERRSDIVVVDAAAGVGRDVLSILDLADVSIIVSTPEPTSIADAYALIKCSVSFRNGMRGARARRHGIGPRDARLALVVNQARDVREAVEVHRRISAVAQRFLGARVAMLGRATAEGVPHGIHPVDSAGRAGPPLTSWREPGPGGPMPRLFGPRRSWAVRSDGAVWATPGDRYEVRLAGSEESGVRLLRRGTESPAVPPALREAAVERFLAELKGAGLPGLGFRAARDELEVADRLPAIGELWHSDVDGRLWVGIPGITPDGRHVRIVAFDVFGSDGTLRGRLRSPPGFELLEVRADRLYGLHVDGMDVERPRVLRLIR